MAGLKPRHSVPERSRWGLARPGAAFQLRKKTTRLEISGEGGLGATAGLGEPLQGSWVGTHPARRAGVGGPVPGSAVRHSWDAGWRARMTRVDTCR